MRIGLLLSALLVIAGGAIYLAHHGAEPVSYSVFKGQPPNLRSLAGIIRESVGFHGRGLIMLGLLVLTATPVARVMFSVVAFGRQRDFVYLGVTLWVLGVLLFSLLR